MLHMPIGCLLRSPRGGIVSISHGLRPKPINTYAFEMQNCPGQGEIPDLVDPGFSTVWVHTPRELAICAAASTTFVSPRAAADGAPGVRAPLFCAAAPLRLPRPVAHSGRKTGRPRRRGAPRHPRGPSAGSEIYLPDPHVHMPPVRPARTPRGRPTAAVRGRAGAGELREMGGARRNLAPRNHFLVWIVKPSGCHCTDAFGGNKYRSAVPS